MSWTRSRPVDCTEVSCNTKWIRLGTTKMILGTRHKTSRTHRMLYAYGTNNTPMVHLRLSDLMNGLGASKQKKPTQTTPTMTNLSREPKINRRRRNTTQNKPVGPDFSPEGGGGDVTVWLATILHEAWVARW